MNLKSLGLMALVAVAACVAYDQYKTRKSG